MSDLQVAGQIIALSRDGVLVSSLSGSDLALTHVNAAFERITGYARDEVIGKNCRYLQGSDRLQPEIAVMRTAIAERRMTTVTLRNYRKDGTLFWNEVFLCPLLDSSGTATHCLGLIRDVTAMRDMASRLDAAARLDPLTGALNRHAFIDAVDRLRAVSRRPILIAKLDILSLREVNSGYGYDAGDALITQAARRLSDLGADILGQFGESEFVVSQALQTAADANSVLARITAAMTPPFSLPGAVVRARFALGYVIGDPTSSALALTRQAGSALRQSRASRLNDPREFDHESELAVRRRIRMTADLQQALQDGDFLYHYQPKVDLHTGQIIGAEALIRWQHSLFGLQAPGVFIQIAEETHLILDIEARGLRDVAAFAARVNAGRTQALVFSVNISPIEVTQRDLVALVRDVLAETGADPAWITLELTEGLLTEGSPEVLGILHALRALGVGLAIDDFGTGHSSLRYLDTFPMSEIKIDQSFVRDLRDNGVKRIIAETVIALGRHLGVEVVAEGIETEAEKTLLQEMRCPTGQGYLFSRPVGGEAFLALVRRADKAARRGLTGGRLTGYTGSPAAIEQGGPSMAQTVNWGIISTALIGREKVIPGMQKGAVSRVLAIASRNQATAEATAQALGIPRAYGSYEALLADPDIHAVYNPLPNHLHVPWSIRALEAGKHVLCEKPIALDAEEVRTLLAARDRTGLVVAEAFMVRYTPWWQRVRALVREGRLGRVAAIQTAFSYYLDDPTNIRNMPEIGGGGLMDIGCYAIATARTIWGAEPLRVAGLIERDPAMGTDRLTSAVLQFPEGHLTFTCSTQLAPHQRVTVMGTKARIEVLIPFNAPPDAPCRILIDDGAALDGSGAVAEEFGPVDQYMLQGDAVSRAILGEAPLEFPLEDAIANMRVIDAVFRAAESGGWEAP